MKQVDQYSPSLTLNEIYGGIVKNNINIKILAQGFVCKASISED